MISAVVITLNEAINIKDCIISLKGVTDDIVVMDTGSTDNTIEIAKEAGARVFQTKWLGYGPTKNHAVTFAKYDWILSIDADERINQELAAEIKQLKLNTKHIYAINILTNYCGTWIRHSGWFPSFKKRIYHRNTVQWDDREVHENLILDHTNQVIKLDGVLLHYSYRTSEDHWKKGQRYAKQGAEQLMKKNKRVSIFKILFGPAFRFFRMYILKRGFLDGQAGFQLAIREARMVKWRYDFYKKMKKNA